MALGCSSSVTDPSIGSGGTTTTANGGQANPGSGGATGGNAPSGGAPSANGGSSSANGGASNGGASNGGSANGGSANGGSANGGTTTTNGGTAAGGTAAGGAAGATTGGRRGNQGGAMSGGAAAGGTTSGGTTSGGATSTAGTGGACVQNLGCMLTAPASTGDAHQDCVDRINQFRTQCACLPALARWTAGEACADQMAQYDSEQNSAHAGFIANICSGGQGQNECPGWGSNTQVVSGCLQQMWNEGPPPTASCTGTCFSEHGHYINMTGTNFTKVACGFYTTSAGKVWSVQNFSK
ncbi:MAG: CAP domain-containing protein [Polyangiaceae bacterium]